MTRRKKECACAILALQWRNYSGVGERCRQSSMTTLNNDTTSFVNNLRKYGRMPDAPITKEEREHEVAWAEMPEEFGEEDFRGVRRAILKYETALSASESRVKELEAENAKMLEALRPFADHDLPTICRDDHGLAIGEWGSDITVGDFRRARAAYGETVDDDRPVKPASGSVTTISEPIRICAARDAICPNGSDCKEPCAKLR